MRSVLRCAGFAVVLLAVVLLLLASNPDEVKVPQPSTENARLPDYDEGATHWTQINADRCASIQAMTSLQLQRESHSARGLRDYLCVKSIFC